MKITILDGNAVNPGDLSWAELEKLGSLTVYPRTAAADVIARIGDSDAVLLNKVNITEAILAACPSLKYIGVQATGYNVIDLEACRRHGVTVTNVPSYSTAGVAQLVFSFISEWACHVQLHSDSVMAGGWVRSPDFVYWEKPLFEIEGKTLGIFGYGNIGSRVARIAEAYGMRVIVCTRTPKAGIAHPVDFDTLLKESDFISLHAPLTDKTKEIINRDSLARMKKGAYLINTARGGLVNEADVRAALEAGSLAGYAGDVVLQEPMSPDCPLLKAPNCLLTPHIAWASVETRRRLMGVVIGNLQAWMAGTPVNVVS